LDLADHGAGRCSSASIENQLDVAVKIVEVSDVGGGASEGGGFRCNRVEREVLEFFQRLLKDGQ